MGISYKFPYKESLYSEISTVYTVTAVVAVSTMECALPLSYMYCNCHIWYHSQVHSQMEHVQHLGTHQTMVHCSAVHQCGGCTCSVHDGRSDGVAVPDVAVLAEPVVTYGGS
jgi:hypothetical protein